MKFLVFIILMVLLNKYETQAQQAKQNSATQILKFLQSIPADAKEEMDSILRNTTLTKGQIEEKLNKWAKKQPGDFPARYNEIKELLNIPSSVPNKTVSNAAEQAINNIHQNKSITRLEERKAILEILAKEPIIEEKSSNNSLAFPFNM